MAAVPYHGGSLGRLTYERQRAERLHYEADQQAALRGAVVGAGAALVIWSGGTALFAIEELTVPGGALGTTATQAAATGALRTTTIVVPFLLGEYSIIEGLRQNDPGRIADGLMMAMPGGAAFGPGLGAGPQAGGPLADAARGVRVGGQAWRALEPGSKACQSGCEAVARSIQRAIGGQIHRIKPPAGGARVLGGVRNSAGQFVNPAGPGQAWSYHDVVVRDGRVYDAFTGPQGRGIGEYKGLWEYGDLLNFGF